MFAVPGIEESTSYGTPAFHFKARSIARLHQDRASIVLWVEEETRDHLLQADPRTFFVTDHYRETSAALARLDRLSAGDLRKLVERSAGRKNAIRRA